MARCSAWGCGSPASRMAPQPGLEDVAAIGGSLPWSAVCDRPIEMSPSGKTMRHPSEHVAATPVESVRGSDEHERVGE